METAIDGLRFLETLFKYLNTYEILPAPSHLEQGHLYDSPSLYFVLDPLPPQ